MRGDRTAPDGLAALAGGEWDVAVDTWDGAPRAARDAARALVDASATTSTSPAARSTPTRAPGLARTPRWWRRDPDSATATTRAQGRWRAGRAGGVRERALVVRAGLILGPGEDIGRLPWWLRRIARGGDVLAPGPADLPVQYVDVRDLAG